METRKKGVCDCRRLSWRLGGPISLRYRLDPAAQSVRDGPRIQRDSPFSIFIPGLDHLPQVKLEDFWIDRYEVTNQAFKKFVDDGGYQNRTFWTEPFESDGRTLRWDEGLPVFTTGPDVQDRPRGSLAGIRQEQGDYPVTGISWYQAAACTPSTPVTPADRLSLEPRRVSASSATFVPLSNFGGRGPLAVGTSQAMNRYGA